VDAAGHSVSPVDYAFKDFAPLPGSSYYRLEQVDLDGSAELSRVVSVFHKGHGRLLPYPKPARDMLNMAIELENTGYCEWIVQDGSARTVLKGGAALEAGSQRKELLLGKLAAGAYQLVLRQGGSEIGRARFVKQ